VVIKCLLDSSFYLNRKPNNHPTHPLLKNRQTSGGLACLKFSDELVPVIVMVPVVEFSE